MLTQKDRNALVDDLDRLYDAASAGPMRPCGANDKGCECGLVWSLASDFPILTTDTDSEVGGISSSTKRKAADAAFVAELWNRWPQIRLAIDRCTERPRDPFGLPGEPSKRSFSIKIDLDTAASEAALDRLIEKTERLQGIRGSKRSAEESQLKGILTTLINWREEWRNHQTKAVV